DMYWKTYEPIGDDQIRDFEQNPIDYMPYDLYESEYKEDKMKIRKYIMLAQLFEYLAFLFALQKLRISDPFGHECLRLWTSDLSAHREFIEIKNHYRRYYPDFCKYADKLSPSTHESQKVI